jgi:hypothetical protein
LGFRNDLSYARILKGGEQALQTALSVNARDAGRVSAAGAFVKEQSYTLQKTPFGKTKVKDPRATAAKLKTVAATTRPVDEKLQKVFTGPDLNVMLASAVAPVDGSSVWDKVTVLTASAPGTAFKAVSPVVAAPQNQLKVTDTYAGTANRIVTLAAQYVLSADQTNAEQVKSTMSDPMSLTCLDEAQLSYFGCVSASYTRYELSFCLARHGLRLEGDNIRSIGGCFSEITR